jgi:hypothetical protein
MGGGMIVVGAGVAPDGVTGALALVPPDAASRGRAPAFEVAAVPAAAAKLSGVPGLVGLIELGEGARSASLPASSLEQPTATHVTKHSHNLVRNFMSIPDA